MFDFFGVGSVVHKGVHYCFFCCGTTKLRLTNCTWVVKLDLN